MIKRIFIILIVVLLQYTSGFCQTSSNINLLANDTFPPIRGRLNDIWGYSNGTQEYALIGFEDGVGIVDVTNPNNPNEIFYTSGFYGVWRDLKVWNDHVYITNETAGGLMIIDMSNLPGSISSSDIYSYSGSTYPFTSAHDIFIDENGVAYVMGADNGVGGAIMLDLTIDSKNPVELGRYDDFYLHDGMVRGDTLWGAAILDGFFAVIDVSNKMNPVTLVTHTTPNAFTHNCWVSDNGNTLFTTDERAGAYIGAFDVSDLSNITELDRIQSNPGNDVIPHNTFFINDYIVTSYYNDGVTIHDVSVPNNMVEVGHYDTSPLYSGNTSNGCWGVYPYLPSGIILASDRENGLFVLGPNYIRGARLEGNVTNILTSAPIDDVDVDILTANVVANTNVIGDYNTGIATPGIYEVVYSKLGFESDTVVVNLSTGSIVVQDVQLEPSLVSSVSDISSVNDLSIYPNPFTSEINISIANKDVQTIELEILDLTGRKIDQREFKESQIISYKFAFKNGIYFMNVYGDGILLKTEKLIKF